ncbi:hypothetical protein PG994_009728 [Apiospora phragmitis]|uniref:AB hydrolase-1 domain-containing protein n=1 Tax=Apiospora phragmitis TaxID=2905665 RepID=A0ABR1U6X6_9PEZI
MNFLPYLAQHGYPAYALSLRGHGASQKQRWLRKMFFTNLHSWAADVRCVLAYMATEAAASRMSLSSSASSASSTSAASISSSAPSSTNSASSSCSQKRRRPPPVVVGHSLGGGVLQWMLSSGAIGRHHQKQATEISGLVLLGSLPLSGSGREVLSNWEEAEAERGALRRPFLLSERCLVRTRTQARAAFFSDETEDAVVETWLRTCKTKRESAMAGMSVLWPFGEAAKVLESLSGLGCGRKVLCVAGSVDKLVPPAMVLSNAYAYAAAAKEAGEGLETCRMWTVRRSGHHLMMDAHWQECADGIVRWLGGDELPIA